MPRQNIVILGAGFAGISAAKTLLKSQLPSNYRITILDEQKVHLYTPDLYEIATAFTPKITMQCLIRLKDSVVTPLSHIFPADPRLNLLRDTVKEIDPKRKKIKMASGKTVSFDYLIVTLGSVTNYYNIPGLQEYAYPLKTVQDGLVIHCHLDTFFQNLWSHHKTKNIEIVVGGGGATGVESACELPGAVKKLCKKYNYPRNKVSIRLIEGSDQLCGSGERGTRIIAKRCRQLGIKLDLETRITKVTPEKIYADSKKKKVVIPYDILLWTGGVMPHPLARGLTVNKYLQSVEYKNIFMAGDSAKIVNKEKRPVPLLAQLAVQQGKVAAFNLVNELNGRTKKVYEPSIKGVIIPLGGRYAFFKKGPVVLKGFLMWILRRAVDLRYAIGILPLRGAIKKWVHDTNIFMTNDL